MSAHLLVASNRGPVSFSYGPDGGLHVRRGGGGLVSGLGAATRSGDALWVCSALSAADRTAAHGNNGHIDDAFDAPIRMLDIPSEIHHQAYNGIANSVLWFINHMLYDLPNMPAFDDAFRDQWAAYVTYNETFARALAEEAADGAKVVIQDYHLMLAPGMLRELRPDLRIGHFMHTPWAPPEYFDVLPDDIAEALVWGLLGADNAGFLTQRWADAFVGCARRVHGVEADGSRLTADGRTTTISAHSLGVDAADLLARAAEDDVEDRLEGLRQWANGRQVIVRIDRTELSKNIVRGLLAFQDLLERYPDLRGQVVHLVFAYPSREDLAEYRSYTATVRRTAQAINEQYAMADWTPIQLQVTDDYARSLAAMRLADVLVVNPIRDGMNLVAKEGPILSDDGVALVLSREAGAAAELGGDAFVVNPYDVVATADAIYDGLTMDPAKRRWRSERLAHTAGSRTPQTWFAEQLAALD